MNKTRSFVLLCLMAGSLSAQQSTSTAPSGSNPEEKKIVDPRTTTPKALTSSKAPVLSDLVKAAKKSPASRDKAKISIDNNSVKKSKGKLSEMPGSTYAAIPAKPVRNPTIERYDREFDQWKKDVEGTRKKTETLEQQIADLEAVVGGYEENFYNEDDPGYREVLEEKYTESQERLEKARQELTKVRDEQQTLENSRPRVQ